MRVLILGGTRFIGPRVVAPLVAAGHDVAVFHRGETPGELPASVAHLHGDRDALAAHRGAFEAFAPDVVIHMILATAQDAWTARQVFEGLTQRFVLVSSIDVYRAFGLLRRTEPSRGPADVEHTPLGVDAALRTRLYPYREGDLPGGGDREQMEPAQRRRLEDYDKIPVEQILLASTSMRTTVLRLPMVVGPGDPQRRLHGYLKRMDHGREAILLGARQATWRTTRGYVDDIGLAIALAATTALESAPRVMNLGDPAALSEQDWVRAIARVVGWEGRIAVVPDEALPRHLNPDPLDYRHDIVVEVQDAAQALALPPPTPIERMIAEAVTWERLHPPQLPDATTLDDYLAEDAALRGAR